MRPKLSRRGLAWALEGIGVPHLTVARVAGGLGSWNTADDSVLAEGEPVRIDDPTGPTPSPFSTSTSTWRDPYGDHRTSDDPWQPTPGADLREPVCA